MGRRNNLWQDGFRQAKRSLMGLLKPLFVICLALGLSGCMEYDMGIQFNHAIRGTIVQSIHLQQMGAVGSLGLQQWFQTLEQTTQQLHGYSQHPSSQDLVLKIPFANGNDLVDKFNQLFSPTAEQQETTLFPVSAQLNLTQKNALLAVYNQLELDIDLTQLAIATEEGDRLLSLDPLVQLNFELQTPWGVQWQTLPDQYLASMSQTAPRAGIALQSGQINHLRASFWLPSPIGIGTVFIALLVSLGYQIRRKLVPEVVE